MTERPDIDPAEERVPQRAAGQAAGAEETERDLALEERDAERVKGGKVGPCDRSVQ